MFRGWPGGVQHGRVQRKRGTAGSGKGHADERDWGTGGSGEKAQRKGPQGRGASPAERAAARQHRSCEATMSAHAEKALRGPERVGRC